MSISEIENWKELNEKRTISEEKDWINRFVYSLTRYPGGVWTVNATVHVTYIASYCQLCGRAAYSWSLLFLAESLRTTERQAVYPGEESLSALKLQCMGPTRARIHPGVQQRQLWLLG